MKHDVDGDGSAIQSPRRPDGSLGSPRTICEREHVDRALDRGGRSPHELDRRRLMQAGTAPVADFQSVSRHLRGDFDKGRHGADPMPADRSASVRYLSEQALGFPAKRFS